MKETFLYEKKSYTVVNIYYIEIFTKYQPAILIVTVIAQFLSTTNVAKPNTVEFIQIFAGI